MNGPSQIGQLLFKPQAIGGWLRGQGLRATPEAKWWSDLAMDILEVG